MSGLTYDHLVIALGKGAIEVGQGHDGNERLPAILFGRNGAGAVGIETEGDRAMLPGECIAAITFENVESLDVVAEKIAELRARIWPSAANEIAPPLASSPVEYQFRARPDRPDWVDSWSSWDRCTKEQYDEKLRVKKVDDWYYEVRALGVIPADPATGAAK